MEKIAIKFDDFLHKELNEYLSSLNGVSKVEVDIDEGKVYFEYDSSVITLKILMKEIELFLNTKILSIISFDKHNTENIVKETIVIKDLCCEHCLNGLIQDLMYVNGVSCVDTDFDYINQFDVNLFISYNDEELKLEEIENLIKENHTGVSI